MLDSSPLFLLVLFFSLFLAATVLCVCLSRAVSFANHVIDVVAIIPAISALFLLSSEFDSIRELNENFKALEDNTDQAIAREQLRSEIVNEFSGYIFVTNLALEECEYRAAKENGGIFLPEDVLPFMETPMDRLRALPLLTLMNLKFSNRDCLNYNKMQQASLIITAELDAATSLVMNALSPGDSIRRSKDNLKGSVSILDDFYDSILLFDVYFPSDLGGGEVILRRGGENYKAAKNDRSSELPSEKIERYSSLTEKVHDPRELSEIDPPRFLWVYLFTFSFAMEAAKVVHPLVNRTAFRKFN